MVGSSLNALPSSLDCILHSISVFLLWQQFADVCLQQQCVFTLLCSNVAMDNRHLMIFPLKILKPPRKTGDFLSPQWIRGDFPKSSQPQVLRYCDERLRRGAGDVFLWSLRKPRTPRRAATGEPGSISDGLHGTSHWDDKNRS